MKNVATFPVVLLALSMSVSGQDYLLDAEAASPGKEISITRPKDGFYALRLLLNDAAAPKSVQATISQFSGDRGTVDLKLLASCVDQAKPADHLDLDLSKPAPLCLSIPPLPGGAKFLGNMTLTAENGKILTKAFAVTIPQAALTVQAIQPQVVTRRWSSIFSRGNGYAEPQQKFRVVLSEKSGLAPAEGVMAGLAVSKAPAAVDLIRNVAFRVGDRNIPSMDSSPTDDQDKALRTVPAGGQLGVEVSLIDLEPGEYNAVLRFSAPNSIADDTQKQTLTIQVRDPLEYAIFWLLVAVSVSFIATKVLTGLRRRTNLQRQIRDLSPQWLSVLPPTAAVVWVRAVLSQANKLSSRFWLTSPDLIDAQVNAVRSMLKILDQAHQVRGLLARALDPFLFRRVQIGLDAVVSRLEAGAPDDATAQRIQADLKAFEDWLAKDKILTKFQTDVMPDMRSLENEIASDPVPGAAQQEIAVLRQAVQTTLANPPQTVEAMNDAYRKYARLRALWSERADVAELAGEPDLQKMLDTCDARDWERLKGKMTDLSIRTPTSESPDGLEAFVPLQFSVQCKDQEIAKSYLFRHRIEYAWTFTLIPNTKGLRERIGVKRKPESATRTVLSRGPVVVQYFPRGGTVQVGVELRYEGDSEKGPDGQVVIHDSSDFRFFKGFEKVEVTSWVIAAAAAIVTGLSTFYFKNSGFGSYQDYLSLIVWGAGVDQTKNFVQDLQSFSTAPPAGQTH